MPIYKLIVDEVITKTYEVYVEADCEYDVRYASVYTSNFDKLSEAKLISETVSGGDTLETEEFTGIKDDNEICVIRSERWQIINKNK